MQQRLRGVIDGCITDIEEVRPLNMPVFYRQVSAITTRLLGIENEVNVPISIAGVTILPGDLILGDENGVMVVPRDQINELQRVAAEKEARDPATHARLDQGEALKDLSGAARFAHYIDYPYGKA